jgi:hypothetical protein
LSIVNRVTPVRPAAVAPEQRKVVVLFAALVSSAVPCLVADHHGYTWSLLLFCGPSAAIVWVHRDSSWLLAAKGALLRSWVMLAPMGVVLNLALADRFFVYPNRDAVLGFYLRGIPLEEFVFYCTGFPALMLVYLWVRHELFDAGAEAVISVVRARPLRNIALCVALTLLATLARGAVPEYLAYLLLVPLPVTLAWLPVVRPRLHWPSFALTLMALLLVSVAWEVTLAVPSGWWGYREQAMVGLFVKRWSGLPLEAVAVWFLSALTSVVVLEMMLNRSMRTRAKSTERRAAGAALRWRTSSSSRRAESR